MSYTCDLRELRARDTFRAGGKAASLGELMHAGVSVPGGFVVLADAYERYVTESRLAEVLESLAPSFTESCSRATLHEISEKVTAHIGSHPVPNELAEEILAAYGAIGKPHVVVRSSATVEDSKDHAWAGQLDTFVDVEEAALIEHVRKCWASLFSPRALSYRIENGLHTKSISVAVVVQEMVDPDYAGVAFSVHPVTEDTDQVLIEAVRGLGEAAVSGAVTPDRYVVSKQQKSTVETKVSRQTKALLRSSKSGVSWQELSEEEGGKQFLPGDYAAVLAAEIERIESHYGAPQDIEWILKDGNFFIVQSRPITTLATTPRQLLSQLPHTHELTFVMDHYSGTPFYLDLYVKHTRHGVGNLVTYKQGVSKQYYSHNALREKSEEVFDILSDDARFADLVAAGEKKSEALRQFVERHRDLPDTFNELLDILLAYVEPNKHLFDIYSYNEVYNFKKVESVLEMHAASIDSSRKPSVVVHEWMGLSDKELTKNDLPTEIVRLVRNTKILAEQKFEMRMVLNDVAQFEKRLLNATGGAIGINKRKFVHIFVDEFEQYRNGDVSLKELQKRAESRDKNGVIMWHDGSTYERFESDELVSYIDELDAHEVHRHSESKGVVHTGTPVVGGVVEGVAIKFPYAFREEVVAEKIAAMEQGQIIIARSTGPELSEAFPKAAAIVAGEGGVTSHAAVIAREYGIPTIVGAGSVFDAIEDGDLVEVDAHQGTVRKLNSGSKAKSE